MIGPEVGKPTCTLPEPTYLACHAALIGFAARSMLIASRLEIQPLSVAERKAAGRPLHRIASQPAFAVAVLAAAGGYGVMNLPMTATPLAMDICGLTWLSSGVLIGSSGWSSPNRYALPIVGMTALASALLWLHRRSARNLKSP